MTDWFLKDDPGYLAWLVANPDGYVLNTWAHAAAGYLVLHHASCRTINRELSKGRSWTRQYGKACAGSSEELVAWALSRTGSEPSTCALCWAEGAGVMGGSRRPAPSSTVLPTFEGTPVRLAIERMDNGPTLVIDGAQWLAEMFFRFDASATGALSYDASTLTTDKDRFEDLDVAALNRTMAARTAHKWWTQLFTHGPSPILSSLGKDWDLIEASDEQWAGGSMASRVAGAIAEMRATHRGQAVNTKMLHLKRPALVPVLDSLVIDQLGGRGKSVQLVLEHLRSVGRSNMDALHQIQAHLASLTGYDARPIDRTIVRILDALLWSTNPASVLYPMLGRWRTTLGVQPPA